MTARFDGKALSAFVSAVLFLPGLTGAAPVSAKHASVFDPRPLVSASGPAVPLSEFDRVTADSPLEPFDPVLADSQSPSSALAANPSSASFLIADPSSSSDTIQPDPRPKMKKFILAVLLLGALVRYLTSPSYFQFVRDVTDPWAS
jgi:hypothetical protein